MNVDVGGGTVEDRGVRRRQGDRRHRARRRRAAGLRSMPTGRIVRVEEAGRRFGAELGIDARRSAPRSVTARRTRSHRAWRTVCSRRCAAARRSAGGTRAAAPRSAGLSRTRSTRSAFPAASSEYIYGWRDERRSAISARCSPPRSARGIARLGPADSSGRARASAPP